MPLLSQMADRRGSPSDGAVDVASLLLSVLPSAVALRPRGHSDGLACAAVACLYHALHHSFPPSLSSALPSPSSPATTADAGADAVVPIALSPEAATELRAQVTSPFYRVPPSP